MTVYLGGLELFGAFLVKRPLNHKANSGTGVWNFGSLLNQVE